MSCNVTGEVQASSQHQCEPKSIQSTNGASVELQSVAGNPAEELAQAAKTLQCFAGREAIMRTVVIPRADWSAKLNEFSAVHDGWRVSLDVLTPEMGAQPEIANLPLRGVAAELDERDPVITIAAGWKDTDQITHTIHTPTRVQLEQNDSGADVALAIESSDAKAILRITSPAMPETVDGIPKIH